MKKFALFIFVIYLFILSFSILINPNYFFLKITETLEVWVYKVYPSIFTFYMIATFLINFNLLNKLLVVFKRPLKKYNFNTKAQELFITSIFIGNPSSASIITQEIENGNISINEGNRLLRCASFLNPLFILSFLSFNIKYAIILIFVHIISNFIICLFNPSRNDSPKYMKKDISMSFDLFLNSINKVMSLLISIAGIMVFCNIFRESILITLRFFHIDNIIINLFLSTIEVSSGLNYIVNLQINNNLMLILFAFLCGFGGISIHLQVLNIIKDKLNYFPFFVYRILQGIISSSLIFIFLQI